MEMEQLIVNIGSASKKYAVYEDGKQVFSCHFEYENTGCAISINHYDTHSVEHVGIEVFEKAIIRFLELYTQYCGEHTIAAVGIRVVAPGNFFQQHRIIDHEYIEKLRTAKVLAPIHITATLKEITLLREVFPTTKLIAVSDSAFHVGMPLVAKSYGLPSSLVEEHGIQRYGYHGLSVASTVETLTAHLGGTISEKTLVLHLGSGCSITALRNGKTVDTSMGFTPLEGLLMSTRSGSFDPAIVLAFLERGMTKDEIEHLVNKESGLRGVSGITPDMREIIAHAHAGDSRASHAIDVFVYQIQKHIGAYMVALGGVDAIVFTGTIGERSFIIREKIIKSLESLTFYIHNDNNNMVSGSYNGVSLISSEGSRCAIYVVPANESRSILEAMATC